MEWFWEPGGQRRDNSTVRPPTRALASLPIEIGICRPTMIWRLENGVTTFLTPPLLSALDRYRLQQTQLDSRSVALRRAFWDWCAQIGYVAVDGIDP